MQSSKPIRIMIVDSNIAVHMGLITYLETHDGFELVAGAFSGVEAITRYITEKPDLVLLAMTLPGCSTFELIQRLHEVNHRVPAIFLTTMRDAQLSDAAMAAGAACTISKDVRGQDLVSSIREAMDKTGYGSAWFNSNIDDINK